MPRWLCDWNDCKQPAVQRAGDCRLCDRHLCRTHTQDGWHKCPKPDADWNEYWARYSSTEAHRMNELQARINGSKLCARASLLREGIPCVIDLSTKSLSTMMGGQNCHAEITFEDNVKWLARFRFINISSPPIEARDHILRTEVGAMEFLQQYTNIPSPKIFDWACDPDPHNPLGNVGYILMEKLEGQSLDWHEAKPEQRRKILTQLVDIFLEIEKHPFDKLGSITPVDDAPPVSDTIGLACHPTWHPESGEILGPFGSSIQAARAVITSCLEKIASGEIAAHFPVDVYLAHRLRLEILEGHEEELNSQTKFFLKHPDDKGDHILVDEDYNIVGIIDWEWCRTVSKAYAFSSPCLMWPINEFYDGSNEIADDERLFADLFAERGREDVASYVMNGRKAQRFRFGLGVDSECWGNHAEFQTLFLGLRRAFGLGEENWEEWKVKALDKWKEDRGLQRLLQTNN
ncbi:hypothetical protein GGR57DRAFT_303906 [Xylariaceae sp. FL1272]|nr:hypothetical protein GGR57DRAFT_303906 [Xylariaceae sp. FL1272]